MDYQKKYTPALGYDFLTAYYDMAIKITMPEKKFRKLLVDETYPQANEQILEFGFGTGQNLILMQKENPSSKLQGLDIDPKVKA
ncbi:MAG: class I SAM-dependent methyltransferase, partial [Bacteroidota bacterium]